jgi:preprotein translocase subunit SecG
MLTLAQLSGLVIGLMIVGFFFLCLVMILTVLIQKPQGGGLSGAFGSGAGSGQTAFGARTGDALTVATISIFVLYVLAAIGLNYVVRPTIAAPPGPEARPTGQPAPDAPATGSAPVRTAPAQPAPTVAPTPAPDAAPAPPPSEEKSGSGSAEEPGSTEPGGGAAGAGEPGPG